MHLKAKPPVFVPYQFWAEIEKLSKAALMDLVWDFATTGVDGEVNDEAVMAVLRERAQTVTNHRA